MDCHQIGASAQQDIVQAWVIKINGVTIQWIRQSELAKEPMVSGFKKIEDISELLLGKYNFLLIIM